MAREGFFRHRFDPDEGTPLPRPFQLEGEDSRQREAVPLKAPAPPKKPRIPTAREALKKGGFKLYPDTFLRNLPHVRRNVTRLKDPGEVRVLSQNLARLLTGNKTVRGGTYVRWVVGYSYDPLSGRFSIPRYRYQRIDESLLADLRDPGRLANDTARLMRAARWLYRFGEMRAYRDLARFMRLRTQELRREQTDAARQWIEEYNRQRNRALSQWRDSQRWWRVR